MFNSNNDFSLYIEKIREEHDSSVIDAVIWFAENESDKDYDQIVRMLNKKLRDEIEYEARRLIMLKDKTVLVDIFDD